VLASDVASSPSHPSALQNRLALSAKVIFWMTFAFWAYLRLIATMDPDTGMTHAFSDVAGWCHFGAAFVHGTVWLVVRVRELGSSALKLLDATNTLLPCFAYAAMGMTGSTLDIEFAMSFAVMLTLLARAIIVPSSGRRTLVVSTIAGLSTVVASAVIHRSSGAIAASIFASMTLGWMTASTALATVASAVIYGLRREVRRAMQLGQYTLLERIGEGGMGAVYRANHAMLKRPTAIKLLPPDKVGGMAIERFEREVQLTAELTHPNTIRIYDFGRTADGVFYYAMELLNGGTLNEIVETFGPLPPARVVAILEQVAGALREAHDVGLIHRDIKPANILLCRQGGAWDVAKVVDFGLVKQLQERTDPSETDTATLVGTPMYMAPECITARAADGRSDIYSLGAVGYYLLTGSNVFDAETVVEVLSHHLHTEPERPSLRSGTAVPAELEAIIMACLDKTPEGRPQDALSLRDQLRSVELEDAWSEEQAASWWAEHGDALARSPVPFSDTLAVDLGRIPS
jgi:eukaryotic-like serine/threonine-protein kinase